MQIMQSAAFILVPEELVPWLFFGQGYIFANRHDMKGRGWGTWSRNEKMKVRKKEKWEKDLKMSWRLRYYQRYWYKRMENSPTLYGGVIFIRIWRAKWRNPDTYLQYWKVFSLEFQILDLNAINEKYLIRLFQKVESGFVWIAWILYTRSKISPKSVAIVYLFRCID